MAVELMEAPDGYFLTLYFFLVVWLCWGVFMILLITLIHGGPPSPFIFVIGLMLLYQVIIAVLLWIGFSYQGRGWLVLISLIIRKVYPIELALVFAIAGALVLIDRPGTRIMPVVEKVAYFTLIGTLWILKYSILEAYIKRRNAFVVYDTPMTMP